MNPRFFLSLLLILICWLTATAQDSSIVKWTTNPETVHQGIRAISLGAKKETFVDSLESVFRNEGFLEVVREQKQKADSLFVTFHLGRKYYWKEIYSGGIPMEFLGDKKPVLKDYNSALLLIQEVILKAENQGFPFAKINFDEIQINGDSISAQLVFDSGPLILWDSVLVSGETKTQAAYIQKLSGIQPGTVFSQKQLDQAALKLRRSPYYTLVREPELTFQIQKAQPIFQLKDRNTNVLDGIIGFLPNENERGKMLITGQLDLELYNLSGKGRDVEVHWQRLNEQSQSLEIAAKESFLFNSPLDIGVGFSLLKQDTTFLNRFLSLDFGYRLSDNIYLQFFTKRQAGDLISTAAYREVGTLPDVADFRWNQYGINARSNFLDDPIFPRKGSLLEIELAAGNKKIIQNTGIPERVYADLDLSSPQYQARFNVEKHIYIKSSWGMWFKGSSGLIQNDNLLLNDLFRLGGLKTIRGFNENFFYARSFVYLSMEQRLFFAENSYLMVFADAGVIENPYFAPSIDKPISFGAGLNLDTGSGVFRFIYGVGKSNLQPLEFSYSRIHFGYLARF